MNKFILFLGMIFLIIIPNVSAVIISEIMYAPTQSEYYNEWIEIYNGGNSDIDLSNWTLCETILLAGYIDHTDGEKLKLNSSMTLHAGAYAIISDGGSGTEVYSNFNVDSGSLALHTIGATLCGGLSNNGETITLEDSSGNIINSITYNPNTGANNNGKSLQLCSGNWTEALPTPGQINSCNQEQEIPEENNESQQNQNTSQNISQNQTTIPKKSIELNYSNAVNLESEFAFKIKLVNFEPGIYDIKIDILENENRIAKILNQGSWSSTMYYLENAMPYNEEKEFSVKIVEEFKTAQIIIKIRNADEKVDEFSGYQINKSEISNLSAGTEENKTPANLSASAPNSGTKVETQDDSFITGAAISDIDSVPKDIKSKNLYQKLTENNYAKYGLIGFFILIAILFLIKNKKRYKNEFQN